MSGFNVTPAQARKMIAQQNAWNNDSTNNSDFNPFVYLYGLAKNGQFDIELFTPDAMVYGCLDDMGSRQNHSDRSGEPMGYI